MDLVPTDIIYLIFSYLAPRDLNSCSLVSQKWYYIAISDRAWLNHVERIQFPASLRVNYKYAKIEAWIADQYKIGKALSMLQKNNKGGLYQLEKLTIRNTCVQVIFTELFLCSNLVYLDFFCDRISHIEQGIGGLVNLRELCISSNKLDDLPVDFSQLSSSLVRLDLSDNLFRVKMPDCLYELTSLSSLNLSNNKISIVSGIENLVNLTALYINYTNLDSFSEEISLLTRLERLYLNDTGIREIHLSARNLVNLCHLELAYNKISDFSALCTLSQLKSLFLNDNCIENIPENINSLVSLKTLELSDNLIWDVPESLYGMNRLRHLYVSDNTICENEDVMNRLRERYILY